MRKKVTHKKYAFLIWKILEFLTFFLDFSHRPLIGKRILPYNVRIQNSNVLDKSNASKIFEYSTGFFFLNLVKIDTYLLFQSLLGSVGD